MLKFIIPIPADYQNKASYSIFREHEGEIQEITTAANANGEYIVVNGDKTEITLYAKYFSTYALAYTEYSTGTFATTYTVTVDDADNGSVSVSTSKPTYGTTVTISTTPDDGYEVGSVTVTNASGTDLSVTDNGDGTYSFKQLRSKVTITVTFVEIGSESECEDCFFVDVNEDDWFYNAVKWAVDNDVTSGTTTTTFSPYEITTRGQTVTFLWRSMGMPQAEGDTPFSDVADAMYYSEAVRWAVINDITLGTSDTTFTPDMDCSRAQIITLLWRMIGQPVVETENPFTDVSPDAYYYNAVLWAVNNGITTGITDTTFSPDEDCTRGQIVTFLYRVMAE